MAEFGWAYIECSSSGGGTAGGASGPSGSLQFMTASGEGISSGSLNLVYKEGIRLLALTGTLDVSGAINANEFNVNVTNRNIINISATGSTKFGDTEDDVHQFTGSLNISGGMNFTYYKVTNTTIYSASASDYIIGVSASNGVTIRLPSASVDTSGRVLIIKDEFQFASGRVEGPTNQIAISGAHLSSDTVDHQDFYGLSGDNASVTLYSDGSGNWFIT